MIANLSDLLLDNTKNEDNSITYPMNCVLKINQETVLFYPLDLIRCMCIDKLTLLYLAMFCAYTKIVLIDLHL